MERKAPYLEARLYLEGLVIILESLEGKEDQSMNIGILTDIQKQIGNLKDKLVSYN